MVRSARRICVLGLLLVACGPGSADVYAQVQTAEATCPAGTVGNPPFCVPVVDPVVPDLKPVEEIVEDATPDLGDVQACPEDAPQEDVESGDPCVDMASDLLTLGRGGTASAFVACTRWSFEHCSQASWRGNAVGMNRRWTYSWYIELWNADNGRLIDNHKRENFSGTTSVSTPDYSDYIDPLTYGHATEVCTRFALYHSKTIQGKFVDSHSACSDTGNLGTTAVQP